MGTMNVGGGENDQIASVPIKDDIISELPMDLIESILEQLPIRDAVRTSTLSKNWRYNWFSIKKLTFDEDFFYKIWDKQKSDSKHAEIVYNILMQHSGFLHSLFLHVVTYRGGLGSPITADLYNRSLSLASSKGVKDCTIVNGEYSNISDYYESDALDFFPKLNSCPDVTQLKVENLAISIPPTFCSFINLVRLEFSYVYFCGESLQYLMCMCTKLEYLTLVSCGGPYVSEDEPFILNVCSSNVKHLTVLPDRTGYTDIDMKQLETLCFGPDSCCCLESIRLRASLDCLKSLEIHYLESSDLEMLVCLFQSAPNIVELMLRLVINKSDSSDSDSDSDVSGNQSRFWISGLDSDYKSNVSGMNMEEIVRFWEARNNQVMLKQLKLLKLEMSYFSEEEFYLVKVLLSLTPALDKIDVVCDSSSEQAFLRQLVQYPRASPTAKLVFDEVVIDW